MKQKPKPVPAKTYEFRWPLSRWPAEYVFLPWLAIVLYGYWPRFGFDGASYILDQLSRMGLFHRYLATDAISVLVAVSIGFAAYWLGSAIAERLGLSFRYTAERAALNLGIGFAALSFSVLTLGAIGGWYPWTFAALLAGTLAVPLTRRRIFDRIARADEAPIRPYWENAWRALALLFFLLFFFSELSPEIFYDALFYHIAIPNLYRLSHRIYSLPTSLFSNYILLIQHLYGLALTLGHEVAAKLVHGALGVSLAITFVAFANLLKTEATGLPAAVLFFSMPLVGINIATTGIDIGWSFFQTLGAYWLIRSLSDQDRRGYAVAGLFAGLAVACKYPALAYVPVAGSIILWRAALDSQRPWSAKCMDAAVFGLGALIAFSPFMIRNFVFHHNPVYPLGGLRWGHPRIDPHYWAIFRSEATIPDFRTEFSSVSSAWRTLLHPWYMTMGGGSNGDFIGPVYLVLLPFVFLLRSPSAPFTWLRRYALLLWVAWFASSRTPRYGLAMLAIAAPLLAEVVIGLCRRARYKALILAPLMVLVLQNAYSLMTVEFGMGGWQVVGGLASKSDYLSHMHASYPTPPYPAIEWMNQNLPENANVLFVGEARNYYMERIAVPSSVHDPEPLMLWSHQSPNASALAQKLRSEHVTHLYFSLVEATRNRGYGALHWDKNQWPVFQEFWNHYIELLWKQESNQPGDPRGHYVYRLLTEEEASRPHTPPMNPFQSWAQL